MHCCCCCFYVLKFHFFCIGWWECAPANYWVKRNKSRKIAHTKQTNTHTEPHIYKTHTATHTQTIIIKWIKLKWIIIHNEHATFFVLNFLSICIFIKYIKHTHTHSHSHFLKQTQMDNGQTHIQNHWIKPLYRKKTNSKKFNKKYEERNIWTIQFKWAQTFCETLLREWRNRTKRKKTMDRMMRF